MCYRYSFMVCCQLTAHFHSSFLCSVYGTLFVTWNCAIAILCICTPYITCNGALYIIMIDLTYYTITLWRTHLVISFHNVVIQLVRPIVLWHVFHSSSFFFTLRPSWCCWCGSTFNYCLGALAVFPYKIPKSPTLIRS